MEHKITDILLKWFNKDIVIKYQWNIFGTIKIKWPLKKNTKLSKLFLEVLVSHLSWIWETENPYINKLLWVMESDPEILRKTLWDDFKLTSK